MPPRSSENGYTCKDCSRWFESSAKLTAHRELRHGTVAPPKPGEPQEVGADA